MAELDIEKLKSCTAINDIRYLLLMKDGITL